MNPTIKTVSVAAIGAVVPVVVQALNTSNNPKLNALAGALTILLGLFIKRPQDRH